MTRGRRCARLICLFLVLGVPVFAVTRTFNVASGNWNVAGNWSPPQVPGSNDDVIINFGRTCVLNTLGILNNSTKCFTISPP